MKSIVVFLSTLTGSFVITTSFDSSIDNPFLYVLGVVIITFGNQIAGSKAN